MSGPPPPLRFLGVVVGGWVCARAAVLAPGWITEEVQASEPPLPRTRTIPPLAAADGAPPAALAPPRLESAAVAGEPTRLEQAVAAAAPASALSFASGQLAVIHSIPSPALAQVTVDTGSRSRTTHTVPQPASPQPLAAALAAEPRALAVSGWAVVRDGGGSQLATGGVLGGSQMGARATYRLTPSLALSGRISSPLESDGAEAAVGVEWQPVAGIPVKLLAERRQAIGDEGRSAFALLAHGGVSDVKVAGPVTADFYAQAGVVGARERDLFVDGAAKLSVPVSKSVSVGAGAWGAAQPDLSRLDVGPHITLTLPGGGAGVKVSAEYRVRVAGDAEPGSGPAITLATDF